MTAILRLENVTSGYQGVPINRNVKLEVTEGQVVAIVGRNGVGKSTLARTIAGQLRPSTGEIFLAGKDVTFLDARRRALAGIGYVPQGREVFARLTVEENLSLGTSIGVQAGPGIPMPDVYELFPILRERRWQKGGTLSGGQQQVLAIGRSLATQPKVLLLDEPTEGIQPSIIDEIAGSLLQLNRETGLALLIAEQNLDFCLSLAQKAYVMSGGTVARTVTIDQLRTDKALLHEMLSV